MTGRAWVSEKARRFTELGRDDAEEGNSKSGGQTNRVWIKVP